MQVFNIFWKIFRDYNFNTDLLKFIKALKNKTILEVKMFYEHIYELSDLAGSDMKHLTE